MNPRSRSENAQRAASSFSNHEFDFGLGPSFSKSSSSSSAPLKQQQSSGSGGNSSASWSQKPAQSSYASWSSSSSSSSATSASTMYSSSASASSWTWQSNSGASSSSSSSSSSLLGPRSMVGDITGKSWGAMDPSNAKPSSGKSSIIGSLNRGASPDLFGDLIGSSSGFGSSVASSAKKNQEPAKSSVFPNIQSMAASLPRGVPLKDLKVEKSVANDVMGDFVSASTKPSTQGSDSSSSQGNGDGGWGAFESFTMSSASTFASTAIPSQGKKVNTNLKTDKDGDDVFGAFQGTSSASAASNIDPFAFATSLSSSSSSSAASTTLNGNPLPSSKPSRAQASDPFSFISIEKTNANSQPPKSSSSISDPFESVFGKVSILSSSSQSRSSDASKLDPFESVLGKASSSNPGINPSPEIRKPSGEPDLGSLFSGSKKVDEPTNAEDDWGFEASFGGVDHSSPSPTELSDLPPPPPGISASLAKDKGLGFYKQGQFSDAIQWLSWAEVLLQKSGGTQQHLIEVLTCRSSCLKEAGEYKKAVADCSKVIELDNSNIAVLLQRALLYESMEKYKLGIADLKEVLKREPQNRVANNTLSRLKKMAD